MALFKLFQFILLITMMSFSFGACGSRKIFNSGHQMTNVETLETAIATEPHTPPSSSPQPSAQVVQTSRNLIAPRLLTAAELGWVERNLFLPDREIMIDHSFWLGLRDLGEVAFVSTKHNHDLELHIMQPNGEVVHTLPPNLDADSWILWELKAVSFQEIDFDGSEPDIIVIADYIIGAGPRGSETFPVTTVYFNQGNSFTTDRSLNQLLTERQVSTIAEAENILRGELLFLP